MTINHSDTENPANSPDYSEPDATIMLVDCLCGNVGNRLELSGCSAVDELVYTATCEGDECRRSLKLTIGAKNGRKSTTKAAT